MRFMDLLRGYDPRDMLKPPTAEEDTAELKSINATKKEIAQARGLDDYICPKCGYHQGVSWDGKLRRCKGCGNYLRYWRLAERILELRGLEER